jgi:hypothetical protein
MAAQQLPSFHHLTMRNNTRIDRLRHQTSIEQETGEVGLLFFAVESFD